MYFQLIYYPIQHADKKDINPNNANGTLAPTKMSPSEIISKLPPDSIVIGERFLVGRTLGEGSFG